MGQLLRASRDTQVDANAHGLAGAQVRTSCVSQEAQEAMLGGHLGKAEERLGIHRWKHLKVMALDSMSKSIP